MEDWSNGLSSCEDAEPPLTSESGLPEVWVSADNNGSVITSMGSSRTGAEGAKEKGGGGDSSSNGGGDEAGGISA